MALRVIIDLPENLVAERDEYFRLFNLGVSKTTSGDITFVSSTSSKTYNTVGTVYANQGQVGMQALLFNGDVSTPTNPKLMDYSFKGSDNETIRLALANTIMFKRKLRMGVRI